MKNPNFFEKLIPAAVKKTISESDALQKIIKNVFWLISDQALGAIFAIVALGWVARYLGPKQFGILSYAIAFSSLFMPIARLGLDNIVIRDLVKFPEKKHHILGTSFFLMMTGSWLAFFCAIMAAYLVREGEISTIYIIGIVAFGEIIHAFDTLDFWFQSNIQSKFAVYSRVISRILASIFRILLAICGAPLYAFALVITGECLLMAIGYIISYTKQGENILKWRFKFETAKHLLKASWPLAVSTALVTVYMRIDQIMLREMVSDQELGYYSAALRIINMWLLIPGAIITSMFPAIIETKKFSNDLYKQRLQQLYDLITWMGIIVCSGFTISAWPLCYVVYGSEFPKTPLIMATIIWSHLFILLSVTRGKWLIAENLQKYSIIFTGIGTVINIVANYLLIPRFQAMGAVIATLFTHVSIILIIPTFIKDLRPSVVDILKSFNLFRVIKELQVYIQGRTPENTG